MSKISHSIDSNGSISSNITNDLISKIEVIKINEEIIIPNIDVSNNDTLILKTIAKGATGPPGGIAEIAYLYNTIDQIIEKNSCACFSNAGVVTPSFVCFENEISEIQISIGGLYKIAYVVSGFPVDTREQTIKFSVLIGPKNNQIIAPGSTYESFVYKGQLYGKIIIHIDPGDVVSLLNTSNTAVQLNPPNNNTNDTLLATNVALSIKLLK